MVLMDDATAVALPEIPGQSKISGLRNQYVSSAIGLIPIPVINAVCFFGMPQSILAHRFFIHGLFVVLILYPCRPIEASQGPVAATNLESKTSRDFSHEPVVIEYIHESMRYENDGSGIRELRSRIRVQTNAGLTAAGQLVFQYNALDEEIEVRSIRVVKKDGTVTSVGPEAVQDLSAPLTLGMPMYTDARQKHITVPGLSVGDVVEYDVAINAKPVVPGHFWRIWSFTNTAISLDEQLDLNVPKDRVLKLKSPEGLEPSVSVEGNRRIYHWATSNFKAPAPIDLFKGFRFDVPSLLKGSRPPPPPG